MWHKEYKYRVTGNKHSKWLKNHRKIKTEKGIAIVNSKRPLPHPKEKAEVERLTQSQTTE